MKKINKIFIIVFLLVIYMFFLKIENIPNSIIIYEGESLNLKNFFGISYRIDDKTLNSIEVSYNLNKENQEKNTIQVRLFDTIKLKEINIDFIKDTSVIPIGQLSGLKLYTNGVLVVGMSEIKSVDNKKYKPYIDSDIEEGDRIIRIDGIEVTDTLKLIELVNKSNGKNLEIQYIRDEEKHITNIKPVLGLDNSYKLGLWVRDTAAGIGTITIYEPSSGNFAALGHGIMDIDTGNLIKISNGEFITTKILSIIKGNKGNPGKIQGSIENGVNIGLIFKNTNLGIYGTINNLSSINIDYSKEMKVAKRNDIKLGKAYIMCNLENNIINQYEIEIEKIYINNDTDNKSMLIKVKDQKLLEKTGGIIQGMSGSPIIQDGKFVGAITNVLVNDPTRGYGIFGDIMIKEMKE